MKPEQPQSSRPCLPALLLFARGPDGKDDPAANYCTIGAEIGHELTHGFDSSGRLYGAKGNVRDWWTQADAFEILPGLRLNGALAVTENLADVGGVAFGYAALQEHLREHPAANRTHVARPECTGHNLVRSVMTNMTARALAALAALALAGSVLAADGPPRPRKERVKFAQGASSATIRSTLNGDADVDYLVRAAAGQTLEVKLQGTNVQNDFNVLPPGSANVAMFVSNMSGERSWSGMLPADGDYTIRVYLNRPAARRHEASKFTLTVAVTGKALPPLSAARDAKVAGTAYHATAEVKCTLPYQADVKSCQAGVVRRGNDGTATFEAIGPMGVQRRILFVQGKPVAADTMDPVTATRQDDRTVVKVSDNESYDVPDAFLNGG